MTTEARHWPANRHRELFGAIASLRNQDEVERFLRDLCTRSELDAMAHRWEVAQLLEQGQSLLNRLQGFRGLAQTQVDSPDAIERAVLPRHVAPLPVQVDIEGRMAGRMQYGTGDEMIGFSRDRVDWVYLRGDITGTTMDATISNIHCLRRLIARRS